MNDLRSRMELIVACDRADAKAVRKGPITYRYVYYQLWNLFPGESARWMRRSSGLIDADVFGDRFGRYEGLPKWHDHGELFKAHGRLT